MTRIIKRRDKITLGVQCLVSDTERRVLLVRHGYRPGWHFPGGGVERGESITEAITRELEEEAGIVLGALPRLFGIYAHFDAFPGDHIVLFVAKAWRQARVPEPNREIAEIGFFALDGLPDGTTQQTKRRIHEVFSSATKNEHW